MNSDFYRYLLDSRSEERIVLFECDDMGSLANSVSPRDSYFYRSGLLKDNRYTRADALFNRDDLARLAMTLDRFEDIRGNHPSFHAFFNVANPCLDTLISSGFSELVFKDFREILLGNDQNSLWCYWKTLIAEGRIKPHFHGLTHLNIPNWYDAIKGSVDYQELIKMGCPNISNPNNIETLSGYRTELYFRNNEDFQSISTNLLKGLEIYEQLFGLRATRFAPTNGFFHVDYLPLLKGAGITSVNLNLSVNTQKRNGRVIKSNLLFESIKGSKSVFYRRNSNFEPTDPGYKDISNTLHQIDRAFKNNRPAIISTHRVNFISSRIQANGDKGILELNKLLSAILSRWPDVSFG